MVEENKILKNNIIEYFKECNIEIPSEVKEAIDQVFEEFEFISNEDDDANIYMKEDILDFQDDLTITNAYNIVIDGISAGVYKATYTYYGDVDYVVNERTDLEYKKEVIETLTDFQYSNKTTIKDPSNWIVTVAESINWGDGDYTRIPKLYIYCPHKGDSE